MNYTFLGHYLIEQGLVTQQQVDEAIQLQDECNRLLGSYAIEAGLLTEDQVGSILDLQRMTDLSFGELAVLQGFVSKQDVDTLRFRQQVNQVHIGEALLQLGYLDTEHFSKALKQYTSREKCRRTRLSRLGFQSCASGLLESLISAIEKAFLRFAHCPLKAQGLLQESELGNLPFGFSSSIALDSDNLLAFTLHLGWDMLSIISRCASGEELPKEQALNAAQDIANVICHYLNKSLPPSLFTSSLSSEVNAPESADGELIRLKLACPRAAIGMTAALQHGPPDHSSLC